MNLTDHLPTSPELHQGTLSNQLQYYVYDNPHPKGRATVHLVVSVGSLAEEESERGVAHFLEHLAFRGTKSFDHGELIQFFEKSGMSFGHHVNAHTGQAETIYKLDVPIDQDTKLLASALDVLAEWANGGIRISEEDVEAERNIIEEEWRGRQGAAQRMLESYWQKIFADGKSANLYAERFPIGKLDVVRNVTSAEIKHFYQKWYRTDTCAVVVVGDFHNHQLSCLDVVAHIKKSFDNMAPPPANASAPPTAMNPIHRSGLAVALTDAELTATAINVEFFKPIVPDCTLAMVKDVICKKLFTSLLDRRLRRLSKTARRPTTTMAMTTATLAPSATCCERHEKGGGGTNDENGDHDITCRASSPCTLSAPALPALPVLLTGSVGVNPVVPTLERTTMSVWTRRGDELKGMEVLAEELITIANKGFTSKELTIAREKWRRSLESQSKDPTSTSSSSIARELKYHFCQGLSFAGPSQDKTISLQMLDSIRLHELNEWARQSYDLTTVLRHDGNNGDDEGGCGQRDSKIHEGSDTFCVISSQIQQSSSSTAKGDSMQVPTPAGFESDAALAQTFKQVVKEVMRRQMETSNIDCVEGRGKTKKEEGEEEKESDEELDEEKENELVDLECEVPNYSNSTESSCIVEETSMKSIDAFEWRLKNGIRVCVKKMDREGKEGLQFQGFALRGRTELDETDDTNFCFLPDLVAESGMSNLDGFQMSDLKGRTNCRVNVQKHFYHRGLGGR